MGPLLSFEELIDADSISDCGYEAFLELWCLSMHLGTAPAQKVGVRGTRPLQV